MTENNVVVEAAEAVTEIPVTVIKTSKISKVTLGATLAAIGAATAFGVYKLIQNHKAKKELEMTVDEESSIEIEEILDEDID